jgi:hypothetical protein
MADMTGLRTAFKEWAVICQALAQGRQALILRKGGIAEAGGAFRVEHERFWLFPTWVHQQNAGVVPELAALLGRLQNQRPPEGVVRLELFAEVQRVLRAATLEAALALAGLHGWSEDTVKARFAYRTPGLYVLAVKVWRLEKPHEIVDLPYYAGCKSWVELERELPVAQARPVLGEEALAGVVAEAKRRLGD